MLFLFPFLKQVEHFLAMGYWLSGLECLILNTFTTFSSFARFDTSRPTCNCYRLSRLADKKAFQRGTNTQKTSDEQKWGERGGGEGSGSHDPLDLPTFWAESHFLLLFHFFFKWKKVPRFGILIVITKMFDIERIHADFFRSWHLLPGFIKRGFEPLKEMNFLLSHAVHCFVQSVVKIPKIMESPPARK